MWHRVPSTWAEIRWDDPWAPSGAGGLVLSAVVPDVALAVIMGWVYVRTRGSALLAGLGLHTAANFALSVPASPTGPTAITTTWFLTWAIAGCLAAMAVAAALLGHHVESPTAVDESS